MDLLDHVNSCLDVAIYCSNSPQCIKVTSVSIAIKLFLLHHVTKALEQPTKYNTIGT